jgi:heme exporter protein D
MNWNRWSEFFAMGGYGLYVWGSMIAVFAALAWEMAALALRWTAAVSSARQRIRAARGSGNENQA